MDWWLATSTHGPSGSSSRPSTRVRHPGQTRRYWKHQWHTYVCSTRRSGSNGSVSSHSTTPSRNPGTAVSPKTAQNQSVARYFTWTS